MIVTGLTVRGSAEPTAAASHELAADPVLADLIERSLSTLPEVAQAAALAKAERERVAQVGALPDPMIQFGVQNDGFTSWEVGKMETSWYSVMVSQSFPWPTKLRLRSQLVALGASQADLSVVRVRLSAEAEVRRAYLSLMLAKDRLGLLDRLAIISRRAAVVAQARYEAGAGAQSDMLRAQLEIGRIRQRRWALEVEASTAVQTLNRLRGRALSDPITPPRRLADLELPALRAEEIACQAALRRSPELASLRASVSGGQHAVALARQGYFPDLSVNLGVMPRGGLAPMWLASVGVTVPIFARSKQGRTFAESQARLVADQKSIEALEQVIRLRVGQRRAALEGTLEIIRIYTDGLLAQSEATAESALAQYEVGKVTFLSALEANAGLIADQDSFLQLLAQAHRLEIDEAEVSLAPVGSAGGGAMTPGASSGGVQGASTSEGGSSSGPM